MKLKPTTIFIRISTTIIIFYLSLVQLHAQADTTINSLDSVSPEVDVFHDDSSAVIPAFDEIMDTLTVNVRTVSPDAKKSFEDDDDFWYGNTDLKKSRRQILEERRKGRNGKKGEKESAIKEKNLRKPITLQPWFQTMLWIIIVAGFTLFLIIYLGNSNVGLFRKKIRSTREEETSEIPEDIFAINYQREIDKAVADGNFRLAVRLHYLQLLRKLSESNIIRYTQDKTNFDYLLELHPTKYYNSFLRVTRNYEYSWYGQFSVSRDAYAIIKKDFDELNVEMNKR